MNQMKPVNVSYCHSLELLVMLGYILTNIVFLLLKKVSYLHLYSHELAYMN